MTPPQPRGPDPDSPPDSGWGGDARARALERALAEKTTLLHEIDHRVKNNLQLVSSLLLLQARQSSDPAVRQALKSAQARVNAVAIVHRRLFQGDTPDGFDVAEFLRDMVGEAVGQSGRTDIGCTLDLTRVELSSTQAAPLALMVGEVLGEIVGHAFPGRPGQIGVAVAADSDSVRIEISHDGVGSGVAGPEAGFGRTIVRLLGRQLHATCETAEAYPGARTVIRVPLSETNRV